MALQEWHMFLWLFLMLLLFSGKALKEPEEARVVKFISQNFQSVLHWKPQNGEDNSTTHFVQHQQYGNQWSNKSECWGIMETFCDLTRETNPILEKFSARVRSYSFNRFSNWTLSEAFCPMTDTLIGPPKTEVISFEKSILVKVIAPNTTLQTQNGSLQSVEDIYPEVKYYITVSVKARDQQIGLEDQRVYVTKNKTFEVQHLSPGTTYCVSVQIRIPFYSKIGKPSKQQCDTLTGRNTRIIHSAIISSACGTLILVTLSIYLYFKYKYICVPKPHLPAALTTWNRKEQDGAVFSPQIIGQTCINKWEFTELSKYPSASQLQNRYVALAHSEKYVNIASPGRFRPRDFDHHSMPLDTIIFCQYLEQPQFICSDYAQMMGERDALLSADHQEVGITIQWVSPDCCQCQLCCQNKEEFQSLEAGSFQEPIQLSPPGYPDYINQHCCEDPILKSWGLILQQTDMN
ncbi:interferon alpha/beta receptor 2-like [Cetorhinus maximus]